LFYNIFLQFINLEPIDNQTIAQTNQISVNFYLPFRIVQILTHHSESNINTRFHRSNKLKGLVNICQNCSSTSIWGQFHQPSMSSFYPLRSRKHKNTVKLSGFLRFWDLNKQKLHVEHKWNWHQKYLNVKDRSDIINIHVNYIKTIVWLVFGKGFKPQLSALRILRPCERQNFPNFLFLRVQKYLVFLNSWKFCENSSEIIS